MGSCAAPHPFTNSAAPLALLVFLSAFACTSGCASAPPRGAPGAQKPGSALAGGRPSPADDAQINPDRPSVSDGTATVPKDLWQVEMGADVARVPVSGEAAATPLSVRAGLANWLEARVETEGVTREKSSDGTTTGFGGLTLGGKFRLWTKPRGSAVLAVQPEITLPWGRGADAGTDAYVRFIIGRDLPLHGRVDVNYALGAIATGTSHFVQHLAAVEGSLEVGRNWNPYAELYWFSKLDAAGHPALSMDGGATYTLSDRVAIDAGVAFGLIRADVHPAFFGGLSMIVGEIKGHRGVTARLREAQLRGNR